MAAVGALPLYYSSADYHYYMANNNQGSASNFTTPSTGDLQSEQPQPFDLSEYILMDDQGPIGTNFMQGRGNSAPSMEFQANVSSSAPLMETSSVIASPPLTEASVMASASMERPRTERIAFRMQSEVEIVEDGFKWRKYGKKSVKNSPNPRNYYRCSTEGCMVKKRVERDKDDPSYVITTYEGVHNHVTPGAIYYTGQDAASGRYYVAGMQIPPGS